MNVFFQNKYNLSKPVTWIIIGICLLPLLLNLLGVDFGTVVNGLSPYHIRKFVELQREEGAREILLGRNFHTIFVSISIAIAFLTAILAIIDFRIKGNVSTPIVGIALFSSGLLDTFHLLVSTQVVEIPNQQFYITSFTWFFCRSFHASILILGAGIFLMRNDLFLEESKEYAKKFVVYIGIIFVCLTIGIMIFLVENSNIPQLGYPYRNISRVYDLIPLALYLIAAFYVLPRFYEKHPSTFSQTLLFSTIPAIATQLYMAFGSMELFDNSFNIAHFMTAFTYFIPFVGLGLNYLQTHKNEQLVISKLDEEAKRRLHTQEILSGILNSSLNAIMGLKAVRKLSNEEWEVTSESKRDNLPVAHHSTIVTSNTIVDFEFMLLNPAAEDIFNYSFNSIEGRKLTEELPFSKQEGWINLFSEVVISGTALNYEYYSAYLQKWLLVVAVKLDDGLAVTISDISKRKNALKELMDAEKLAVTGRMARSIAHEVRNPLTNINMSLEQMQEELEQPNESVKMYLEIIKRNSERINQLITEMLESSRPSKLEMKAYSVNQLLDETLQLADDRIRLKKIRLEKSLATDIPPVMLDTDKMKTAFLNIIINALEAMEEEKGILSIHSQARNGRCYVEIQDNGAGISKENLTSLFEPFFSKKKQGMGLGLFATHNIILTHKGQVAVESDLGRGTKFTISFEANGN